MDYFYPLKDRQTDPNGRARLSLIVKTLGLGTGTFADLNSLKSAVMRVRVP
jgi:hypothetical protein